MEDPNTRPEAIRPRPDYPPKTPPPLKKPPSPPPPDPPRSELLAGLPVPQRAGRAGVPVMRNRQGAAWSLEAQPWVAGKAVREVSGRLSEWGLRPPAALDGLVRQLVAAVVADGGRHVSLHLAEQDRQALLLAFSHRPQPAELGAEVLPRLSELGAVSCGTEVTGEGRRVWAVLDLAGAAG